MEIKLEKKAVDNEIVHCELSFNVNCKHIERTPFFTMPDEYGYIEKIVNLINQILRNAEHDKEIHCETLCEIRQKEKALGRI